jgi:hypothetical protein
VEIVAASGAEWTIKTGDEAAQRPVLSGGPTASFIFRPVLKSVYITGINPVGRNKGIPHMSSQDTQQDTQGEIDKESQSAMDADQNNDSLATKLSQELSNWRRRRTTARPRQHEVDGPGSSSQSESARTIKVRGHETLVIRKPKLVAKPANAIDRSNQ